ncbi:hypothetical protein OHB26_26530 [Nocardia sp. NBC_01503]|uniref:hypothetical protein n=1 Tax=Nocardia sp. NBC_01503 TaxID=2975997 RepID=UPI002E7C2C10|nr:hypothetical protein [Nocardia sp. NBC_01503]WTL30472.1 hypothetical protein OHB26_26530 [Nocardia sp. NBC_01503]
MALIGDERPTGWIQYRDGSWAPVWRDGRVGPSFRISALVRLAADDISVLDEAGLPDLVIDVEPPEVLDADTGEGWPLSLNAG